MILFDNCSSWQVLAIK